MVNTNDAEESPASQTGAFAAAASRRLPAWAALVLTAVLIAASGWALYLSRLEIGVALGSVAAATEPATVVSLADAGLAPPPARPEAPKLSALEVEAKLAPLPAEIRALIAEGRTELPEFAGRGPKARNATDAQIMESRWQAWGRTWRNRLRVIYQKRPPKADCQRYPNLGASCFHIEVAFSMLNHAADQPSIEQAALYFDDAEAVLRVLPLLRAPTVQE